jgi:GT2 family glycosyltransferase
VDLCHRIWDAGFEIRYTPEVTINHLGGQSTGGSLRLAFELDKYRNRYRYFYKYFGREGTRRCRRNTLLWLWVRRIGYSLLRLTKPAPALKKRLEIYRAAAAWNRGVDPVRLVENGEEPETGHHVPLHVSRQEGHKASATDTL